MTDAQQANARQPQLERFIELLQAMFQLDKPELDFGLYKIMHAKSDEIRAFLESDLLGIVHEAFGEADQARIAEARAEYEAKVQQALDFGAADPEQTQPVKEAKAALEQAREGDRAETDIYDHLYRFFERYYDKGDFMSRRYYARESDSRAAPYAIPYDGREVYLHWANKDQYYIKSSEYLINYSFDANQALQQTGDKAGLRLAGGGSSQPLPVHFRIVEASEGEHGNNKAADDNKRLFIPYLDNPAELSDDGELTLNFEYKTLPDGYPFIEADIKKKYGNINKGQMPENWMADVFLDALAGLDTPAARAFADALGATAPTDKQKRRTLLAKYIARYTARNTMDYFIHKDLGGFLKRELDFYIKNEVMRLDDIENAEAPRVEQYLARIKVIRRVARPIIDMLAQLEDFQKKLWLKKKFVTETNYCITLDRLEHAPELLEQVFANNDQLADWAELYKIDADALRQAASQSDWPELLATPEYRYMMVDTAHFDPDFKARLLDNIDNLDEQCDGLLVHSENFQALNLLQARYHKKIKSIYIDPPYNTDSTPILYKNSYRHSSWASLMLDRLKISKQLLTIDGVKAIAIDDIEFSNLSNIVENVYIDHRISKITVIHNPKGSITKDFNRIHEYCIFITNECDKNAIARNLEKNETPRKMRRWGAHSLRIDRRPSFYPIYVKNGEITRIGKVPQDNFHPCGRNVTLETGETEIWPIDQDGTERRWNFGLDTIEENLERITIEEVDGTLDLFVTHELTVPKTVWIGGDYDAGSYGNTLLVDILGTKQFDFPKSINLVKRCISLSARSDPQSIILDYFGGSGTTAHAVIDLNRQDREHKYITIEVGDHFDSVVKPRTQKVVYADKWRSGTPVTLGSGISHCFKYLRLESYEDTLNNLALASDRHRDATLQDNPGLNRDYLLHYFLNVETQGSPSLLDVREFRDPTAYRLKIKKPGSDVQVEQPIDLVETFNWLIGLWVEHLAAPQVLHGEFERETDPDLPEDQATRLVCTKLRPNADGAYWFRRVEGYTLKIPGDDTSKSPTMVIWRKLTDDAERDNAALQQYLDTIGISTREQVYDTIYINGSHTLPNPVVDGENTRVRLLEEAFHQAMWADT